MLSQGHRPRPHRRSGTAECTLQTVLDNAVTDRVTVADLADLAFALRGGGDAHVNDYTPADRAGSRVRRASGGPTR